MLFAVWDRGRGRKVEGEGEKDILPTSHKQRYCVLLFGPFRPLRSPETRVCILNPMCALSFLSHLAWLVLPCSHSALLVF